MPHFKRPVPSMGPNMGHMKPSGTHNFIMERARAVGNIPAMKRAKAVAPKGVTYKQAGMQGKSTKLATGGPANLRVAGPRVNKQSVRVLPSTKGKVLRGKPMLASTPEKMARGPYKQRTLGVPEFTTTED
jgi:hypothetical protein